MEAPPVTDHRSPPASSANAGVACVRCRYSLAGLPDDGACPECGTPVMQTKQGILLSYRPPEYVAMLHKGVFLIVAGIAAQVILAVIGMLAGFAAAGAGVAPGVAVHLLLGLANVGAAGVVLYGWWLFSEPDPQAGVLAEMDTARKIVRITVVASVVVTVLSLGQALGQGSVGGLAIALAIALALFNMAVTAVHFFAAMAYLRLMAFRLPDQWVRDRATLLRWLGPVLVTVGVLILIGPLIALVLYWNLLDRVRKDIKAIRESQPAGAPITR